MKKLNFVTTKFNLFICLIAVPDFASHFYEKTSQNFSAYHEEEVVDFFSSDCPKMRNLHARQYKKAYEDVATPTVRKFHKLDAIQAADEDFKNYRQDNDVNSSTIPPLLINAPANLSTMSNG